MFRVLVVDDDRVVANGISDSLNSEPDIQVIGTTYDGRQAVAFAREKLPDIVLMDISMEGMDGLEATKHITTDLPSVDVIVLTNFDDDDHLFGAFKAGATGFVVKGAPPDEIAQSIRDRSCQVVFLPPSLSVRVMAEFTRIANQDRRDRSARHTLTGQEISVLKLIAAGRTNRQIANELFVEMCTVRNHVTNVLHKLAANDRMEATRIATDRGILG